MALTNEALEYIKNFLKFRYFESLEDFNNDEEIDNLTLSIVSDQTLGLLFFIGSIPITTSVNGKSGNVTIDIPEPTTSLPWASITSKPTYFLSNPQNFNNNSVSITTTTTLSAENHSGRFVNCLNTNNITINMPTSTSNSYNSVPMFVHVARNGSGTVTVSPNGGTFIGDETSAFTLDSGEMVTVFKTNTSRQYYVLRYKKIALETIDGGEW